MTYNTGKSYGTADEDSSKREIFRNNLKTIEIHNALFTQDLVTYTLGVNEYADMVSAWTISSNEIPLDHLGGGARQGMQLRCAYQLVPVADPIVPRKIYTKRGILNQADQLENICYLLKVQYWNKIRLKWNYSTRKEMELFHT